MRFQPSFLLLILSAASLPLACAGNDSTPSGTGGHGGEGGTTGIEDSPCALGNDPTKCSAQDDVACTPNLGAEGEECDSDEECETGELCFAGDGTSAPGICRAISASCEPIPAPKQGLRFGESCDPEDTTDPCAGECVPIGEDGAGECEQTCRVGAEGGCGEQSLDGSDVGCAFFAYDLRDAGIEQGAGDVGVCAHFCNCNSDCPGDQLCLSAPTDSWAGICAGGIDVEASVPACADGMGGAGGSSG